jgi:hypothetical protein
MRDPIHTTECEVIYTHAYVHADIPSTNTRACLARIPTFIAVYNAIVYTMHKRVPLLRTHASKLCTALTRVFGAWSCGQALQQYAALPPRLWRCTQGCTHMYVCEKSDTAHVHRSRCAIPYYNRVRGHIHPCICACRHTKYENACMPCTYTYLHSSAQRNSIYHAQMCTPTTYSREQAMYCTHLSVWSVELWTSAAEMCCAPFAPMKFL